MRVLSILAVVVIAAAGCGSEGEQVEVKTADVTAPAKTLTVQWQRLVDESGQTCDRCATTHAEIQKAYQMLKNSLEASGVEVVLEAKELSLAACAQDMSQSNRIWVGGRALEDWLGAEVGMSRCRPCCAGLGSEVDCRTLTYEGTTYEAIPADLIVRAGLLAASDLGANLTTFPCCQGGIPCPAHVGGWDPSVCEKAGIQCAHDGVCDPSKCVGAVAMKSCQGPCDPSTCVGHGKRLKAAPDQSKDLPLKAHTTGD